MLNDKNIKTFKKIRNTMKNFDFFLIEKRTLNSLIFDDEFSTLLLNIKSFENTKNFEKFNFWTTSLININLLMKSKKYILESELSSESKKLKFTKYISLYCKTHFSNGIQLSLCYDIDSKSFFIFLTIVQIHYNDVKISKMTNEKKIRCQNIKKKTEIEFMNKHFD